MVNFIICDDNGKIVSEVGEIIDKIMIENELSYKKHSFSDYNSDFHHIAFKNPMPNKVFILDIHTESGSGIDIAREIRRNDLNSIIIFLSGYSDLGSSIIFDELMVLTFINKFNDREKRIESAIRKCLNALNVRKVIRFTDKGTIYTIPADDILYVTRDSVERKCILVTDYNKFMINKTLAELSQILGPKFEETHRSCLVNADRVTTVNKRKKIITFDNGDVTDLVSESYKKRLNVKEKEVENSK